MTDFITTLGRTLAHNPKKLAGAAVVAFSVFWTATEAAYHFSEWAVLKSQLYVFAIVTTSIVYALQAQWKIAFVTIPLKRSNISIEIMFGDIFTLDGVTAIPVGEYFESEFGLPVSPNSLHGIFITRCFGGHPQAFDDQLTKHLADIRPTHAQKEVGKSDRYPIGTTALLESAGKRYLAFALTRSDTKTCKAFADVPLMFEALAGLWKSARTHLNGDALNLPLVGSGSSGIGLPTVDLLHLLLLSFIDESRRQVITLKLRIVLTRDRLNEVDLRKLKEDWEDK